MGAVEHNCCLIYESLDLISDYKPAPLSHSIDVYYTGHVIVSVLNTRNRVQAKLNKM